MSFSNSVVSKSLQNSAENKCSSKMSKTRLKTTLQPLLRFSVPLQILPRSFMTSSKKSCRHQTQSLRIMKNSNINAILFSCNPNCLRSLKKARTLTHSKILPSSPQFEKLLSRVKAGKNEESPSLSRFVTCSSATPSSSAHSS